MRFSSSFKYLLAVSQIIASSAEAIELDTAEEILPSMPIVLTPTRLRQPLADVPASVTIITAKMLEQFGIASVPEALRLVPGMVITQISGNDYRINYHGSNILVPRRMNVLIDGISVYRPGLARVDWKELPVVIEDIERIEVTRGPNSASYGTDSLLAIINIITKHPKEAEGVKLISTIGSLGTKEVIARYGGRVNNSSAYRLTVSQQQDNGLDYSSILGYGHDGTRLKRLNFRSTTDLDNNASLDLQVALLDGLKEVEAIDKAQQTFPDLHSREHYLSASWRKSFSTEHEIKIQAYTSAHRVKQGWRTCVPNAMLLPEMGAMWRANRIYAQSILKGQIPSGGSLEDNSLALSAMNAIQKLGLSATSPICGDVNQDYVETRNDIELQDTFVFSDTLRMVNGIGARQDFGNSPTFLAGAISNNSYRLFSNIEYKPSPWMNINVGGLVEKSLFANTAFSPRAAVNLHLNENHTLRFVISKGTRMPDIKEQRAYWTYTANNLSGRTGSATFYQSAISPGGLKNEQIISMELGYLGNFPQHGILIDAKIYEDKLSQLISEKLQLSEFLPTNNNSVRLRGAELQLNYTATDSLGFYLAYAYLYNDRASNLLEQTQYSKHSGAMGVSYVLPNNWHAAFVYYGASANGLSQSIYGRSDATLSKAFALNKGSRLTTTLTVRCIHHLSTEIFEDFNKKEESRLKNRMQYYFTLKLEF